MLAVVQIQWFFICCIRKWKDVFLSKVVLSQQRQDCTQETTPWQTQLASTAHNRWLHTPSCSFFCWVLLPADFTLHSANVQTFLPNLETVIKHTLAVFIHDTNHSGCQKFSLQEHLLYLLKCKYIMTQKRVRKKSKAEHCPDVGQNRHVFAFMFLNLYCKVATLV